MDIRTYEKYGTAGTKFSFVFAFELHVQYMYNYRSKKSLKIQRFLQVNGAMFEKARKKCQSGEGRHTKVLPIPSSVTLFDS